MVAALLKDLKAKNLNFTKNAEVLLLVNGFGATPQMELYLLFNSAAKRLQIAGLNIARSLVGNYITVLDMVGASITICLLDDETKALWDAPVHTATLRW